MKKRPDSYMCRVVCLSKTMFVSTICILPLCHRTYNDAWHHEINSSRIMKYRSIFIFCCLLFFSMPHAHAIEIDSLLLQVGSAKDDSSKVDLLNQLSWNYLVQNHPDKSQPYLEHALALAKRLNYVKGEAVAHNYLGVKHQIGSDYAEAFSEYLLSAKLNEKAGYKKGIAFSNQSIGAIYYIQGNYEEAINHYSKAGKIYAQLGDKEGIAYIHSNNAGCYLKLEKYDEALENYYHALNLFSEKNNQSAMSLQLNMIGESYALKGDYVAALECYDESLTLAQYENSPRLMASASIGMGQTFIANGAFDKARRYINRALSLSSTIRNLVNSREMYKALSTLDSASGNWAQAYQNHLLYIAYRDSVRNDEGSEETIKAQMEYAFDKKETIARAEQEKKDINARNLRNAIAGVLAGSLVFLVVVYRQRNKTEKERKRSEALLLNILPEEIAEELKANGRAEARDFEKVTVLFTDFKNFTQASAKLDASELVQEINAYYEAFDAICEQYDIEKIKTIGDSYMAAGGLPVPFEASVRNTVLAALEMQAFSKQRKAAMDKLGKPSFEMRVGLHTGPVVAGIVGIKKFQYDIWGDAVNMASRLETNGAVSKVNISHATHEHVKDDPDFAFVHRGNIEAKGKGRIEMWFVESKSNNGVSHFDAK